MSSLLRRAARPFAALASDIRQLAISANQAAPLDEKLRQAYFWIVNTAISAPA